jgi:hypothetical protein
MSPKKMGLGLEYYEILSHTLHTRADYNNFLRYKINEQKNIKQILDAASSSYNRMSFFRRYFTYQGWKLSSSIQENTCKYKTITLFELTRIQLFGEYKFPPLVEPANQSR